jgi:hypothetical protein
MNTQFLKDQALGASLGTIEFTTLDSMMINLYESSIYCTKAYPLPYAFFLKKPMLGRPLIVFGQGDQNRKTVTLPRFQRMDWASKLDYNALIFSDPTLHLSPEMGLGWLLGTKDHYVLFYIKEIIEKIRIALSIKGNNILFYGSSAGGFTSLMLASYFDGSSCLVNNPQTDVLKFTMGGVQNMLRLGFDGVSREVARNLYGNRMSFIERIRENAYLPNIFYLQNLLDEHHYYDHMLPLIDQIQKSSGAHPANSNSRLIFDLYSDAKAMHNPVGFDRIYKCIEHIKSWID